MTVNDKREQTPDFATRLATWVAQVERPAPPEVTPPALSMSWLLRLRWAAVVGQAATVLFARGVLHLPVPTGVLLTLIGLTAISNIILCRQPEEEGARLRQRFERVLAIDTATLTALLFLSGGASNPFSSFYLVHVAMAAVALGRRAAWRMVALSGGCLFLLYATTPFPAALLVVPQHLHLAGMLVSAVLTAAAIALFAGHLHHALQRREAEVAQLRIAAEQRERFAALATLAAGVAHELGSPLGTILVAARELEHTATTHADEATLADTRLIAREAERCRELLGRLNARSTAELGEPPVECSPAELLEAVQSLLVAPLRARLDVATPVSASLFLPRAAVVESVASLVRNAGDASEGALGLRAVVAGAQVRFEVRDTGPPLPAEVIAHVGEPFFSTKQPGRGMGLGLYLVRLLAERLGGSFSLTREGSHTLATLALPCRTALISS